jgi:two-component system, OmpR family, alkaline phosphatase synthesis response regulator PhoP
MAKILVVDDDPTIVELIKVTLKVKGYTVLTANGARLGLNIMLKEQPDMAIIDYMMADRDGLSLLKDIRSIPEFKNTPIIMLTGSGVPDVVSKAIQYGVTDFVVKPFKVLMLLKRVEQNLKV